MTELKRLRAWLSAKTVSRGQVVAAVLMALALPDVPRHPTIEVLNWVILALITSLVLTLIYSAYVTRRRRKR